LAAFDDALNGVAAVVICAYEERGSWQVRLRAGLVALLECLECDRATARLLIVESLAAGPRALRRRQDTIAKLIPVLEGGAIVGKTVDPSPSLTAEGVLGGVLSVLHARLIEDERSSLLELAGPLMGMIVLPYLGPAAARREARAPLPKHSNARRPVVRADPLRDLPMRFTYRTMRALSSIAELAAQGAYPSNRAVGERAGIGDQGQASKLLARLHKLGLIENKGGDPARGEPNAWTLTTTGQQVHDSIAGLSG
jgi:hypothetical protein